VHLSIGVQWNPRLHFDPFLFILFTPMKAIVSIEWLCLVIKDFGRSRVAGTARDRAPSHDGGSMIGFMLKSL
jgi:hypothetical protein